MFYIFLLYMYGFKSDIWKPDLREEIEMDVKYVYEETQTAVEVLRKSMVKIKGQYKHVCI